MRVTMLVSTSGLSDGDKRMVLVKTSAHRLRGLGKNLMIKAYFTTLVANVKLRC